MYYYIVIISQEFSHGSGMLCMNYILDGLLSFCSNLIFQGEPGPKGEKVKSCMKCIKIAANFLMICEMALEDCV